MTTDGYSTRAATIGSVALFVVPLAVMFLILFSRVGVVFGFGG